MKFPQGCCCWVVALLLLTLGQAARPVPPRCKDGCIYKLELVCGTDGLTYQSSCLAVCQGVGLAHTGPCAESGSSRNPRALHLHRLLLTGLTPTVKGTASTSQDSSMAEGEEELDWDSQGGGSASSLPHGTISLGDMEGFSQEGYALVGMVPLADMYEGGQGEEQVVQGAPGDLVKGGSGGSSSGSTKVAALSASSSSDSGTVRALRVTRGGLLYAASYDLGALSAALRALGGGDGSSTSSSSDGSMPAGLPDLPAYIPPHLMPQQQQAERQQQQVQGSTTKSSTSSSTAGKLGARRALHATGNSTTLTGNATVGNTTSASSGSYGESSSTSSFGPNSRLCTPLAFPFTAIGQLELRDASGTYVCSGSMVGPDAVLTAGHCAFKRDGRGGGSFYRSIDFAPGRYRDGARVVNPFNVTSWASVTIFDTYERVSNNWQFDWDVAIIRLSAPVGRITGWLGIAAGCVSASAYGVTTAGYAVEQPLGTCMTSTCAFTRDNCRDRTSYHSCPSLKGQSGSPFYVGRDFRVRGVLVGTWQITPSSSLNVAHLMGPTTFTALVKWMSDAVPVDDGNQTSITAAQAAAPPVGALPGGGDNTTTTSDLQGRSDSDGDSDSGDDGEDSGNDDDNDDEEDEEEDEEEEEDFVKPPPPKPSPKPSPKPNPAPPPKHRPPPPSPSPSPKRPPPPPKRRTNSRKLLPSPSPRKLLSAAPACASDPCVSASAGVGAGVSATQVQVQGGTSYTATRRGLRGEDHTTPTATTTTAIEQSSTTITRATAHKVAASGYYHHLQQVYAHHMATERPAQR